MIKPFWSWNDKLEKQELENQIVQMKENGIEGFFMHARAGLKTEYLSDEWYEMVETCMDKADELGMQAWAYDENGWPSGFADGLVPSLGVKHQQKYLEFVVTNGCSEQIPKEQVLATFHRTDRGFERTDSMKEGTYVFYYQLSPYYVDVFQKETISYFLEFTHEKYYERFEKRFGTSLQGFFTDEPQFHISPWSLIFSEEFEKTYGYDLIEHLPLLFFEEEGYEAVRNDYHAMVAKLFQEAFIKQMYDWCTEHNCKLTGHMMGENSLVKQMRSTNGVMACYEYFHEPGMDHLRRCVVAPIQPKQLGSVARQLGRKTLTETFALCGWDVSLNELKWIAQWQYLNGVTSLCPHLEGYSLRGARKRDYPASVFSQLPWFDEVYKEFADYFTDLGVLLEQGEDIAPLLMIHPIHSAYILQNPANLQALTEYSDAFDAFTSKLNDEHILHHYGDETIMEHYGSVRFHEDGVSLVVGNCAYKFVLLPDLMNLTNHTVKLLLEFAEHGGKIYAVGDLPKFEEGRRTESLQKLLAKVCICKDLKELKCKEPEIAPVQIIDRDAEQKCNKSIHLTMKELPNGCKLLYLINNMKENQSVTVQVEGSYAVYQKDERISTRISDGKTSMQLDFAEYGSYVLYLEDTLDEYVEPVIEKEVIELDPVYQIENCDDNAFTLDKCMYRINEGEWQSEIAVINLHNELLALQKPCNVEMEFTFYIAEEIDFSSVKLCMENPEKFVIHVNDMPYTFCDAGMFIDHSIRKSPLGDLLKVGVNTIRLSCYFKQPEEVYRLKFTSGVHESVLNKLTYDTELESIYLTGRFGVHMEEDFYLGERRCLHGGKTFSLVKLPVEVDITDITRQNFWFFAGKMNLSQNVNGIKKAGKRYVVAFEKLNAPAAKVYVNEKVAGNLTFAPFVVDVTDLLIDGVNKINIVLLSGNRNLLGPHHKPLGESYAVGPETFSAQLGWADDPNQPTWTDDYNFVLFGAEK